MSRSFWAGVVFGVLCLSSVYLLTAANWPSTSGTTTSGVVLEDGAGNLVGTASNPLVCQ